MKRHLIWMTASLMALGAGVACSSIPSYGYGNSNSNSNRNGYGQAQTVRCESINSRSQRCRIDRPGEVRVARQLSRQQCIRGRNWDYTRNEIRVRDGCRADFAVMHRNDDRYGYNDRGQHGRDQVVRCESRGQGRTYCGSGYGEYQMIGYRNANCVQGRTFGQDQRGLWVSGYCNAQFRMMNVGVR